MSDNLEKFEEIFSPDNLHKIFQDHIVYSGGTGIDNINQYAFRKQIDEQVNILSRKILNGTYEFTKYKLKLISKGRGNPPREISIPTVRDRIALRAMCEFLQVQFKDIVKLDLPQLIVRQIKAALESNTYSSFIKLDVSNFYPSINHQLLECQLDKTLSEQPHIKKIIHSAITAPTVLESKADDIKSSKGVPQGLAISNILAAIYLQEIDTYLSMLDGVLAYRYVDDVLILCDENEANKISDSIIEEFSKFDLKIHCPIEKPHKSKIGIISTGFDYLGYDFQSSKVSVKDVSIERLKKSLVGIFTSYKYAKKQSEEFLIWRINLRITGCVFENKSKGWLFFFSEINDEALLHQLDFFISKLCRRFNVNVSSKKFVKAFYEICHRKYETKYVPNFDNYSVEDKGRALATYFGYKTKGMSEDQIEEAFHKKVSRQIKDLEADIKDFSVSG